MNNINQKYFDIPILLICFNRPSTTKEVLEKIKQLKPIELYIVCDGPRNSKDKKLVSEVRQLIYKYVDWECSIKKQFREENFGCKKSVSEGITWFFKHTTKGIILEDDCVPSLCFFDYCKQMLSKYENDKRIFQISGSNLLGSFNTSDDIIYSETGTIWGWATWRDRWQEYDVDMQSFKLLKSDKIFLSAIKRLPGWRLRWKAFKATYENKNNTWDFQWIWARFVNRGLIVIPKYNLIENIGEGAEATHTSGQIGYRIKAFENVKFVNFPIHFHPNKTFEKKILKLKVFNAIKRRLNIWVKK